MTGCSGAEAWSSAAQAHRNKHICRLHGGHLLETHDRELLGRQHPIARHGQTDKLPQDEDSTPMRMKHLRGREGGVLHRGYEKSFGRLGSTHELTVIEGFLVAILGPKRQK